MATRLEILQAKKVQLQAQIHAIESRNNLAERKRDTRAKIVLGAAVLAALKAGRWTSEEASKILTPGIEDRNRDLVSTYLG